MSQKVTISIILAASLGILSAINNNVNASGKSPADNAFMEKNTKYNPLIPQQAKDDYRRQQQQQTPSTQPKPKPEVYGKGSGVFKGHVKKKQ